MAGHALDTSALRTVLRDGQGAPRVLELLGSGLLGEAHEPTPGSEPRRVHLPFVAVMELEHLARGLWGRYQADRRSALVRA